MTHLILFFLSGQAATVRGWSRFQVMLSSAFLWVNILQVTTWLHFATMSTPFGFLVLEPGSILVWSARGINFLPIRRCFSYLSATIVVECTYSSYEQIKIKFGNISRTPNFVTKGRSDHSCLPNFGMMVTDTFFLQHIPYSLQSYFTPSLC